MTERTESFLERWTRVIKTMWPTKCPRCGLTAAEADGMDCCTFARFAPREEQPR